MPAALITGAARRIGAELAKDLASAGFRLALHYNTSRAEAEALAETLATEVVLISGDLAAPGVPERVFTQAQAAFGAIDLLINNASRFVNDDISSLTRDAMSAHMGINLEAPLFLAQAFATQPDLSEKLIINMLDNKVLALNPDFLSYTLSKYALYAATKMLAQRFQGAPRICGIAPSITLISGEQSEENFERTSRINPLKRRVFPNDIGRSVRFLWDTQEIDAEIIALDGGQHLLNLQRDVAFMSDTELRRYE